MPVIHFTPSFPSSKPVQKPYTPNPQQINGKKCHDFYRGNKLCERGDTCIYRHEFRTFTQVQRRYYTTHFMAYEALYDNMLSYKTKDSFLENLESTENYEPQTSRLSVFTDIRRPNNNETHNKVRDFNMTLVEKEAIYGEGQQGYLSSSDIASDAAPSFGSFSPVMKAFGSKPAITY